MNFLPAYLINGEDELKRETVLKRLKSRLSEFGDMDFNSDVFDGDTAEGADIVTACNTMPFASEKRLVVVHRADALKKADSEGFGSVFGSTFRNNGSGACCPEGLPRIRACTRRRQR